MAFKFLADKPAILFKNYAVHAVVFFFLGTQAVSLRAQSYVKFENEPTKSWGSILEKSGVQRYYLVQRGDTLYGISQVLFGDPSFWPKIWSLNAMITNPHKIEKGQIIYFAGGTVVTPPRFGMEIIGSQRYTYGTGFLKPEIPPEPLVKGPIKIPSTFPNVFKIMGDFEEEAGQLETISSEKRTALFQRRQIPITSEIVSKKPVSLGKLIRVQSGGYAARKGDLVNISLKKNSVQQGQTLSLFLYSKGKLSSKKKKVSGGLVEWLGKLKILKHIKKKQYLAEVLYVNDLLLLGADLSEEKLLTTLLPEETERIEKADPVVGKIEIVGADKHGGALVIGENSIVYLKGGLRKGVEADTVYPVYTNFGVGFMETEQKKKKNRKYIPKVLGYIKIAKVNKYFSTGVIFNLSKEASLNDRVGVK